MRLREYFVHYKIKGVEIHSENAAKPASQASSTLIEWLEKRPKVNTALDFGCGKLRYSKNLYAKCQHLTLVDSLIQLERNQKLRGENTNVFDYVKKHWSRARALDIDKFKMDRTKFDFILCSNVLSAIPDVTIRNEVLQNLYKALQKNGECLFVTQYRNSYFNQVKNSKQATLHLDGWILKTIRGNFYYGILPLTKVVRLAKQHKFDIKDSWIKDGSAFVLTCV